jgi:hypothetical protein
MVLVGKRQPTWRQRQPSRPSPAVQGGRRCAALPRDGWCVLVSCSTCSGTRAVHSPGSAAAVGGMWVRALGQLGSTTAGILSGRSRWERARQRCSGSSWSCSYSSSRGQRRAWRQQGLASAVARRQQCSQPAQSRARGVPPPARAAVAAATTAGSAFMRSTARPGSSRKRGAVRASAWRCLRCMRLKRGIPAWCVALPYHASPVPALPLPALPVTMHRYLMLEFPALAVAHPPQHIAEIGCGCGSGRYHTHSQPEPTA